MARKRKKREAPADFFAKPDMPLEELWISMPETNKATNSDLKTIERLQQLGWKLRYNLPGLNEADTCHLLITPALKAALV